MRVAIPTYGSRVAPTFLHCETMCIVRVGGGSAVAVDTLRTRGLTEDERIKLLEAHEISVLVCGGIDCGLSEELRSLGIEVIQNVVGETDEVLDHLARGELRPGHGITYRPPPRPMPDVGGVPPEGSEPSASAPGMGIDCVQCSSRVCLAGGICPRCPAGTPRRSENPSLRQVMEVTSDVAAEPERVLCRVAELVHFCQGMSWKRLGLAFCTDLFSEAEKVTRLLSRYLEVVPVCCRVGGPVVDRGASPDGLAGPECNPFVQAHVLNEAGTHVNVTVGLCMGCDVIFQGLSRAPVTALFVKDRLLANNPIGAVHSRFLLEQLLSGTDS
jgi:uncharacterized metal-binding protein/predicted Fe-Mo cluster-binding NifX family protein